MQILGDCQVNCEVKVGNRSIIHRRFTHGAHVYETRICAVNYSNGVSDEWCIYDDGYMERIGSVNCYGFTNPNIYSELVITFMDMVKSLDTKLFDAIFNLIVNAVRCG